MNKFAKFWFAGCRSAEGEGGGAAGGGDLGPTSAPSGESVAGADAAPPATFLTEQKPADAPSVDPAAAPAAGEPEVKADETAPQEPVGFDSTKLALPEGVTLAEESSKAFADLLNNKDLSPQDRGQQLADLHAATLKEAVEETTKALAEANQAAYTKMNTEWRDQIKALPEFKNDPDGEAGKVFQALTTLGAGKEFFAALDLTGAGNHPAIVQMFHKLTKPFIEGGAVGGGAKPVSTRKLGDAMYTSTNKG